MSQILTWSSGPLWVGSGQSAPELGGAGCVHLDDGLGILDQRQFAINTLKSRSNLRIKNWNDAAVIVCDGVDIVDAMERAVLHVLIIFVTCEETPAAIHFIHRD